MKAKYIVLVLMGAAVVAQSSCLDKSESVNAERKCTACHGSADRDGSELYNAAPPFDLEGSTDPSSRGVGAHQIHLNASPTHGPVPCGECHIVPDDTYSPGHTDTKTPAEFTPGPLAALEGRTPSYDGETRSCSDVYCHLPQTDVTDPLNVSTPPVWNEPRSETCGTCHSVPPAPPHMQSDACFNCHPTIDENQEFPDPTTHVNGVLNFKGDSCYACHGNAENTDNNAPPQDTSGNTDTSARGVGAHQAHLFGGRDAAAGTGPPIARPVPCGECHIVPTALGDAGHTDSALPAENTWSGVAVAFGAAPVFDGATCSNTYCHGAVFVNGVDSGGSNTEPIWTTVDGTQAVCGSCHALPPGAPHPDISINGLPCSACHTHLNADMTFNDPSKHINGELNFGN